jgi:hypothetical protein
VILFANFIQMTIGETSLCRVHTRE